MPLILILRNRLKYAINGKEARAILMEKNIKVDGRIRTDIKYPAGFMGAFSARRRVAFRALGFRIGSLDGHDCSRAR